MSPRPRKASDEAVFAATQRVMARRGPGELALAEIAAEAGVTAGALVQRFGSKRGLLLTAVARWAEGAQAMLDGFRTERSSPLAALRHYAECLAAMGETPGALAHHLSYLQMDLTDPDFRFHLQRNAQVTRAVFEEWLAEAVAQGELAPGTDTVTLARLVEALIGGSLLSWAVHQDGAAAARVARDLDALLAPHRPVAATAASGHPGSR